MSSNVRLFAVAAIIAVGSCKTPDVTFVVHRGAPTVSLLADDDGPGAKKLAEPARPFLNRYDLLRHFQPQDEYPGNFLDYIRSQPLRGRIQNLTRVWWGNADEQRAAAQAIVGTRKGTFEMHLPDRECRGNAIAPGCYLTRHIEYGQAKCHLDTDCLQITVAVGNAEGISMVDLGGTIIDVVQVQDPDKNSGVPIAPPISATDMIQPAVLTTEPAPAKPETRPSMSTLTLDVAPSAADPEITEANLYGATTVSRPLVSFIDLSDVHIREATATLGTPQQSHGLDRLINSFERDFDQVLYTDVLLQALVSTINETYEHCKPDEDNDPGQCAAFAIHTGDAADAGLRSEFDTFHRIMDGLLIPWLSVVGNHDVLVFGNFIPDEAIITSALVYGANNQIEHKWYWKFPLHWLADAKWKVKLDTSNCGGCSDSFLATGGHGSFASGFISAHLDHRIGKNQMELSSAIATKNHGFDLGSTPHARDAGYYRVDLPIADGYTLRIITLNTSDFSDATERRGGEGGMLSAKQLDWLDEQLKNLNEHDLVMVFGHHPMETIRDDGCGRDKLRGRAGCRNRLEALLFEASESRHLLAYVCGHEHRQRVDLIEKDGKAFWEIETGSLIAFPQEVRRITIRKLDKNVGFLELLPFSYATNLNDETSFGRLLTMEQRGAKRDYCNSHKCLDGEPPRDGKHGAVRAFFEFPTANPK